jgi:hypothetical protein
VEKNQRKNLKNKFSEEDKKKDNHNWCWFVWFVYSFFTTTKGIEVLEGSNDRIECIKQLLPQLESL